MFLCRLDLFSFHARELSPYLILLASSASVLELTFRPNPSVLLCKLDVFFCFLIFVFWFLFCIYLLLLHFIHLLKLSSVPLGTSRTFLYRTKRENSVLKCWCWSGNVQYRSESPVFLHESFCLFNYFVFTHTRTFLFMLFSPKKPSLLLGM